MINESDIQNQKSNLDFKTHPKFLEMKDVFEKLFRNKGYFTDKYFDKDIWFLQNDLHFQNMIKPTSSTPTPSGNDHNKMHSLLRDLSEHEDMKKLKIETGKFIEKICEILYNSHQMVLRSKELIKEYNAHENVNVLELKYKMLNEKYSEKNDSISKLDVSIGRLDLFPEGKYSFNFHFLEINPRDLSIVQSKNKYLKDNRMLNIKQGNEIIILNNLDADNTFDTVNFTALSDENPKYQESFEYSGTTLSTFNIQMYKNEDLFAESTPEYFLDMFLLLVEKLRDIDKKSFSTTWKVKGKTNLKNHPNIFNLLKEYEMVLEFKFELDPITRACIINRILLILKDAIKTETQNEMNKNEILDVYFKSISEQVKHILDRNEDEQNEGNCNCQGGGPCVIY